MSSGGALTRIHGGALTLINGGGSVAVAAGCAFVLAVLLVAAVAVLLVAAVAVLLVAAVAPCSEASTEDGPATTAGGSRGPSSLLRRAAIETKLPCGHRLSHNGNG